MQIVMDGDMLEEVGEKGEPISGNTLLILINASFQEQVFILPYHRTARPW
jgi:hypothetical protein